MEIAADLLDCTGCKNAQALVERTISAIQKVRILIILEKNKVVVYIRRYEDGEVEVRNRKMKKEDKIIKCHVRVFKTTKARV